MKILVISTIDNKGGAAGVADNLRRKLKADGHTVSTFVRYKYSNEPDVFVIPRRRYQDFLVKFFANDLSFAGSSFIFDTKEYKEADIVHCHNLHSNFFNLKDLVRMSREKPLVWTLHDMWAFTGFAYNSYTLRHPNKKRLLLCLWDNTGRLLRIKKKIYERCRLNIVTVSDWLKREAEKSILVGQSIRRIWNGIDTSIFKPGNREGAREILGLPRNKKIIGCGIKGWIDSNKIIDSYENRDDLFFVSVGDDHIKTGNKNFAVLPRTEDKNRMALYLQALDIFLHPTPEDSFGLVSVEAMACGVPVVAYNIDALPEIVGHKETGYLAEYGDIEDAKRGLEYILTLPSADYLAMCRKAREKVERNFTVEKMYGEYLELYKKLFLRQGDKRQTEKIRQDACEKPRDE